MTGSVAGEFGRRTLYRQHWGSALRTCWEWTWGYGKRVAPSKVEYVDNQACATCHELQARGRGS